jgi:hypothetical protein
MPKIMVSVRMIWEVYDRAARRLVAYARIREAALPTPARHGSTTEAGFSLGETVAYLPCPRGKSFGGY